jgi:predicted HicB family RNase H-like nuclease
MKYLECKASAQFHHEAGVFYGAVVNCRNIIVFEGNSVEQTRKEFRFSIQDYATACAERGRKPQEPFLLP